MKFRAGSRRGKRNKRYARQLTKLALDSGFSPITVHLYITEVTNEEKEEERKKGLEAGLRILSKCKYILVGTKYGITEGMKDELILARLFGITVLHENKGKIEKL